MAVGGTLNAAGNWDFAVARYQANGRPDWTFGNRGKVVIDFAGGSDDAQAVAVLASGRILVAGAATAADGADMGFGMVRLFSDGRLDPAFGRDGKVVTNFGPGPSNPETISPWAAGPSASVPCSYQLSWDQTSV